MMKNLKPISAAAFSIFLFAGCTAQFEAPETTQTLNSKDNATPTATVTARAINWDKPYIVVEPETVRSIQGISKVDRNTYFSICDAGQGFEKRVKDDAMYDYLVHDLGIHFGRKLGPVKYAAKSLKEDPNRPGFADLGPLTKKNSKFKVPASERMKKDFGPNLDVAAHGNHNAFPEFMGRVENPESMKSDHPQYLPKNIEAAAELSAAVMKHTYNDLDRPRYYEPVNEPYWSFFKDDDHIAKWHVATKEAVNSSTPDVQVGGPCLPTCYFYRSNYKSFNSLKTFIEQTEGKLDFYSFHTYDYLRFREGEFKGRMQSGLALEGTLDLVQNHMMNAFGRETDVVISEHGGYIGSRPKGEYDGEHVAAGIASNHFPVKTFEDEMKKRSIVDFGHVSAIISNTLGFMDHPHTVKKAVPFMLINTWNWDKKYYANLYVPYDYEDKTRWVPTHMLDFYKFFKGVQGERVKALCNDPDLQTRAFADGNKLYLAVNNQSYTPETISLYGIETEQVSIRRFGRNEDFTASYEESTVDTPEELQLAARESLMIIAEYDQDIPRSKTVNEVVCYGDKITTPTAKESFTIKTPTSEAIDYAQLRIGLTRDPEANQSPRVTLNGIELDVPLEDCADRFVDKEYASTKLIYLKPADLKEDNVITVAFDDGDKGAIGSAVIRVAVK